MSYPNQEQAAVLSHLDGTLLVLAPAGTGKTRIMADRLAAVIARGMPPEKTLGVTFTNRAAEHMRQAVAESCGAAAKDCRIQTFHSLCAWMLRVEARDLGLRTDFVVYDEDDSIELLRHCPGFGDSSTYAQISQLKSDCPSENLTLAVIPTLNTSGFSDFFRQSFSAYHEQLAERNALDFSDLLYRTRAMLTLLPEKRAKWAARFRWIQMDEVQDTHLAEYEIIRLLATDTDGTAFFGDLDQTIYEWRGSNPVEVLDRIRADLGPVTELPLRDNYRATKTLLRIADRHAATFTHRRTRANPAPSLPDGTAPEFLSSRETNHEADAISTRIGKMLENGNYGRIAVLTRTHRRAQEVSRSLEKSQIPHLTVQQFDFFRRTEIKDLLARLRLLFNPADSGSLERMIQRPASGIGPATVRTLREEGQKCGLRLTDLAQLRSHRDGEPYHTLLQALARGTVVVFDVETTGLSPVDDEVIDIGAVKLVAGRPAGQFQALLRPTRPLGDSAAIHGISEETLHSHGRDAAEVFHEFARFIEGAVLVGHNVAFDLSMIHAHATRLGITLPTCPWDDTLDLARRFLDLERHDLATVCHHLGTQSFPSHRALADAAATAEVLLRLATPLADGARARKKLISRHGKHFLPIAQKLASWTELTRTLRPADLCQRVLAESNLHGCYEDENIFLFGVRDDRQSTENLTRLIHFFQRHDDPARPPAEMLAALTGKASLTHNLDLLTTEDHFIRVLTVHQAKGLEFDTVIIAGLTEDEFPSYYAKKAGNLEEEKRLFYVSLTRAKRHLVFSSHRTNDWGHDKPPSSFLDGLI